MPFRAASAAGVHAAMMPTPPTLDALVLDYPALQRPLYGQALSLGTSKSPALLACSCALLCSLLAEDLAAREDARIVAARLAVALGRPALAAYALGRDIPVSHAHRQAFEQVRTGLEQAAERDLSVWPQGLAAITRAVVGRLKNARGPWLAVGPSGALAVLFGPLDSRFSLNVVHPDAMLARFQRAFPVTCVLAEPDLDPIGSSQLLTAYAALPFKTLISVSRGPGVKPPDGFSSETQIVDVPDGEPLSLAHPSYTQSTLPSRDQTASVFSQVTLHEWARRT